MDDRCSGYTNKETYDVAVHFQHNVANHVKATFAAKRAKRTDAPRSHLGHWLEQGIRKFKPLDNGGIYYQLLNSALARVNWCEIADGFLED